MRASLTLQEIMALEIHEPDKDCPAVDSKKPQCQPNPEKSLVQAVYADQVHPLKVKTIYYPEHIRQGWRTQ